MARDTLPNVKLRHLQFLLALAEHRNIGRAATAMHMTQPGASRLLAELEQAFGRTLFERGRHGLRPLAAALDVLRFATLVRAEERMVIEALRGGHVAPVRIGTLPTAPSVVINGVRRFKRDRPSSMVSLVQGTLHELVPRLLDGELDLVVARFDPQFIGDRLVYERLMEEALFVVAAPDHPLAKKRRVLAEELRHWPWVVPQRASSLYPHFAELFAGVPLPADLIECTTPMAVYAFLQDGRTLGLLSESVPRRLTRQDIRMLPVSLPSKPGALGIYRVRGRDVAESPMALAAALREAAQHPVCSAMRR